MTKSTYALLVSLAALTVPVRMLSAQVPAPTFEVASIRPNKSGDERSASIVQPGARYTATNVTLRMLIKTAYGVHDDQIVGGPDWIDAERFDVAAKGQGNPTTTEFRDHARLMLRPLLADRFKLIFRRERREIPVYGLVLARGDGRFGPQFNRSDVGGCSAGPKSVPAAPGAAEPSPLLPCGGGFSRSAHLGARAAELSTLVTSLSSWVDRVVLDRTGLTGGFDWDLQWTPEPLTPAAGAPGGLSIFTALGEQLGLKLESERDSVEVLVIESVERLVPD